MPTEGVEPCQGPGMGWRVSDQEEPGQLCAWAGGGGPPWRGPGRGRQVSEAVLEEQVGRGSPGEGGEEGGTPPEKGMETPEGQEAGVCVGRLQGGETRPHRSLGSRAPPPVAPPQIFADSISDSEPHSTLWASFKDVVFFNRDNVCVT